MNLLEKIIGWAVPFLCGGIASGCITYLRMRGQRADAVESGVQCLLRAEIIRSHDKYIARKFCPIYAKEALKVAYQAYHALGGNDVATALYEEVMHLSTDAPSDAGDGK